MISDRSGRFHQIRRVCFMMARNTSTLLAHKLFNVNRSFQYRYKTTNMMPTNRFGFVILLAAIVAAPSITLLASNILSGVASDDTGILLQYNDQARRRLTDMKEPALPSLIQNNLRSTSNASNTSNVTAFFFHIPKAGGTTVKDLYSKCYHAVEADHVGGIFVHNETDPLQVFEPWKGRRYVNVDIQDADDIARAKRLGFAESHLADLVLSSAAFYQSIDLFSPTNQAQMFTMMRHPVERAVSKFYYLQEATWETHYAPETKGWTIEQYIASNHHDGDWVVRTLANKMKGEINSQDLDVAKLFLKEKVLIGLTSKPKESIKRFNRFFGFRKYNDTAKCEQQLMGGGSNSHAHPRIQPNSTSWNAVAANNIYDMQLYDYAVALFEEQSNLFAEDKSKSVE